MAKKKVEDVELKVENFLVEIPVTVEKPKLSKLDVSFPNEDLNKLRDKVNELIDWLNN